MNNIQFFKRKIDDSDEEEENIEQFKATFLEEKIEYATDEEVEELNSVANPPFEKTKAKEVEIEKDVKKKECKENHNYHIYEKKKENRVKRQKEYYPKAENANQKQEKLEKPKNQKKNFNQKKHENYEIIYVPKEEPKDQSHNEEHKKISKLIKDPSKIQEYYPSADIPPKRKLNTNAQGFNGSSLVSPQQSYSPSYSLPSTPYPPPPSSYPSTTLSYPPSLPSYPPPSLAPPPPTIFSQPQMNQYYPNYYWQNNNVTSKFSKLFQNGGNPIILENFVNLQYYGYILVGTPSQNVSVVFDTGSHLLWIPVSGPTKNFNLHASTTADVTRKKGEIQYGLGYVSGFFGSDIITMKELNISVRQELIWSDYQDPDIQHSMAQGILGLSNLKSVSNFLDLAYQQKQIESNVFSFEINKTSDISSIYPGYIPDHFYPIFYLPSIHDSYWMMEVVGLQISDTYYREEKTKAVVDSGTSLLYLGTNIYYDLLYKLNTVKICTRDGDCVCPKREMINQSPKITIWGNGAKFELTIMDYIVDLGGVCLYGLGAGELGFMLFGDVFMRKYGVVYDKENNQMAFSNTLPMGVLKSDILSLMEWMWVITGILILSILFGGVAGIYFIKGRRSPSEYNGKAVYLG